MSTNSRVAMVYAIANALHCDRLARTPSLHVLRTSDVADVTSTMRTVAAAADLPLHVQRDIGDADMQAPPHVVALTGAVRTEDAPAVIEALMRAEPGVSLFLVVPEDEARATLDAIGTEMIRKGLLEADPELRPGQQVPSALV